RRHTRFSRDWSSDVCSSDLRPEPNAVGPRVRTGYQVEELGPDSQFPIHRALNRFRWGAVAGHRTSGGAHAITFGGDLTRTRLNRSEERRVGKESRVRA